MLSAGRGGARSGQSFSMSSILTYSAVARVSMSFSTLRSWGLSLRYARPPPGIIHLGVGEAEVGEGVQQVVVRLEAGRRDLAVVQPGEAHAVDVVGGDAAVGVSGGLF